MPRHAGERDAIELVGVGPRVTSSIFLGFLLFGTVDWIDSTSQVRHTVQSRIRSRSRCLSRVPNDGPKPE